MGRFAAFSNNFMRILTTTVIVIIDAILIIAVLFFMNDSKVSRSEVEDEAPDLAPAFLGHAKPG